METKRYTIFNLAKGHMQIPSGAYLHPKGSPGGMDRAYPVDLPTNHVLWRLARMTPPQVLIVEGDVPHPEPVPVTKKPAAPPPVPAPSEVEEPVVETPPIPDPEEAPPTVPEPAPEPEQEEPIPETELELEPAKDELPSPPPIEHDELSAAIENLEKSKPTPLVPTSSRKHRR